MEIEFSHLVKELFSTDTNFAQIENSIKRIRSWQEITGDLLEVLQVIRWYKYYNYHEQPVLSCDISSEDLEKFEEKTMWRLSMMSEYFGQVNNGVLNIKSQLPDINRPLEAFMLITYFRAFSSSNSDGRLALNRKKVFKNRTDIRLKHDRLKTIRDKLIAHAEWGTIDRHKQKVYCYFNEAENGKLVLSDTLNRTLHSSTSEVNIHDLEECVKISSEFCINQATEDFTHLKDSVLSKNQISSLLNRIEIQTTKSNAR